MGSGDLVKKVTGSDIPNGRKHDRKKLFIAFQFLSSSVFHKLES